MGLLVLLTGRCSCGATVPVQPGPMSPGKQTPRIHPAALWDEFYLHQPILLQKACPKQLPSQHTALPRPNTTPEPSCASPFGTVLFFIVGSVSLFLFLILQFPSHTLGGAELPIAQIPSKPQIQVAGLISLRMSHANLCPLQRRGRNWSAAVAFPARRPWISCCCPAQAE